MKRMLAVTAVAAALWADAAWAGERDRFQVAPFAGAFVATGDQRDVLEDSPLLGVMATWDLHPNLAVVGAFAWAPTEVKGPGAGEDLDLFQYDLGVQGQLAYALPREWVLRPSLGLGIGARTYDFSDRNADAETDLAGYVALGVGAEHRGLELRLAARSYLTSFDGVSGGEGSETRNDLGLFGAVGMRF